MCLLINCFDLYGCETRISSLYFSYAVHSVCTMKMQCMCLCMCVCMCMCVCDDNCGVHCSSNTTSTAAHSVPFGHVDANSESNNVHD